MKVLLLAAASLSVLLAGAMLVTAAPTPPSIATAAVATPTWTYTLYGDAIAGWGLTPATISKPGPTLVVTSGETLALHLISHDGQTHNWTVDVNNDSIVQVSEPQSPYFNATTRPIWYNFTVSLAPKTYTYRCGFHSSSMWGELIVMAAPTFTVWGSAGTTHGWGLTSTTITYPGPTLNVTQGQTVTIDLFSADGVDHTFYVDFAGTGNTTGNTVSADFNGTHPVRFTLVAGSAGNFTYACGIHGTALMKGTLVVAPTAAPPSTLPDYTIYASFIVVIVIVAIGAAIAVRRKPRTPPEQPPSTPPQQG